MFWLGKGSLLTLGEALGAPVRGKVGGFPAWRHLSLKGKKAECSGSCKVRWWEEGSESVKGFVRTQRWQPTHPGHINALQAWRREPGRRVTDWWVTKGTTFSGAWNPDHTILRGREELPFHHPNRWHFNRFRLWVRGSGIPPQCVSSLPVIQHNEESGRPSLGTLWKELSLQMALKVLSSLTAFGEHRLWSPTLGCGPQLSHLPAANLLCASAFSL